MSAVSFSDGTISAIADASGDIYVADQGHDRIVKLSAQGKQLAAWTVGTRSGALANLATVAVDARGHVYVSEVSINGRSNDVRELSATGTPIAIWR